MYQQNVEEEIHAEFLRDSHQSRFDQGILEITAKKSAHINEERLDTKPYNFDQSSKKVLLKHFQNS